MSVRLELKGSGWTGAGMDFDCGVCVYECVRVCVHIYIHIHVHVCVHVCTHVCMHVCMYTCLYGYIQLHILYRIPYLRKGTAPVEPYDHTSRSRPRKMEKTRPGNSVAVSMVHLCHCLPVLPCCH